MNFKEWVMQEMASFSLHQNAPIEVYESETAHGPFHIATYNATGIDMRFEDYAIEGQRPPMGNWAAPLANGKFIVYTAAKPHETFVGDQPGVPGPSGQIIRYPVIRQDWARFAEFVSGNTIAKPAQYDRGPTGNASIYKPRMIPLNNPISTPNQNPSRLQSA